MIDTDKYEGHTQGPWHIENEENNGMRVFICHKSEDWHDATILWQCETTHSDALLVADAPLLLAEVKRLRKDRDLLWDAIRLSRTGGHQEEEIAFWYEKLLNMNEAELKEAFKGHYEDD